MRCLLGAQYPLAILLLANTFSAVSCIPLPEQVQDNPVRLPDETNLRDKATPEFQVPSCVRQARTPLFFPLPIRGYSSFHQPFGYYGNNRYASYGRPNSGSILNLFGLRLFPGSGSSSSSSIPNPPHHHIVHGESGPLHSLLETANMKVALFTCAVLLLVAAATAFPYAVIEYEVPEENVRVVRSPQYGRPGHGYRPQHGGYRPQGGGYYPGGGFGGGGFSGSASQASASSQSFGGGFGGFGGSASSANAGSQTIG
ncbi:Hypothetical predicted protein [Cloeon dipterum]|nr:Hypothetical predicted protein [Cloeon dipterum]